MHVVVVGAGKVGESLARWLVSAGHEIAVVDIDPSRCSVVDDALGSVCVQGDGTDAATLARAGTSRADVLIATTGRDDINLVCCQLARHHFGISRCISIVKDRDHKQLFGLLGIDVVVDVTELVLSRIQEGLSTHGLVELKRVSERDGTTLVTVKIPPDSNAEGRRLEDIKTALPSDTIISLVIGRDGKASLPGDDPLIRPGDEVVAVTTVDGERQLRDILIEGAEE